jgi:nucleotidyltransferase/DNA polymerase involved in DNA repair
MNLRADMDAFRASVGERDRPELICKPAIVGGTPKKRGLPVAGDPCFSDNGNSSRAKRDYPGNWLHRGPPHALAAFCP